MNKSQKYLLKTQFLTNMYMYVDSAHNFQVLHNLNIWPKLWIRSTWNIYIPVVSMTQHIFDLPVYISAWIASWSFPSPNPFSQNEVFLKEEVHFLCKGSNRAPEACYFLYSLIFATKCCALGLMKMWM